MNRLFIISILIFLNEVQEVYAQWTSADSIHLQNILSGKDTIRLNPEIEQLIKEGNLINFEKKKSNPLLPSKTSMPIEIDFSPYITPQYDIDIDKKLDDAMKVLPPSVFMRYSSKLIDQIKPSETDSKNQISENLMLSIRKAILEAPVPSPTFVTDFNDILSTMLSPHYRLLKNNKKNATSWKHYNDLPSSKLTEEREKYLNAHPEARLPKEKPKESTQETDSLKNEGKRIDANAKTE